jgi:NADPH-dependent 2,4-dienoyl-CoA reductase/sulfur reductase-like enzyme
MAAAFTAASLGLKAVLLDEQRGAGGQIYQNVTKADANVAALLGPDYMHGQALADQLTRSGVEVRHGALVWDVARDLTVTALQANRSFQLRAPQLIAATGAMERASPLPGWTLPGVLNAGAAQIALKSAAAVPSVPAVLAGAGPLLLLVACQLLDAGVVVAGIVETSPSANRVAALRYLPAALAAPDYLLKGLRMMWRLRSAGIPWFRQATDLVVEGKAQAEALRFSCGGRSRRIEAGVVLLHHGVVPNTQLTRLLRVEHDWDVAQLAWSPRVNAWGETSLAGFRIAGDGTSIAGALAAEASGTLAAIGAAHAMQRLSDAERDRRGPAPLPHGSYEFVRSWTLCTARRSGSICPPTKRSSAAAKRSRPAASVRWPALVARGRTRPSSSAGAAWGRARAASVALGSRRYLHVNSASRRPKWAPIAFAHR